MKLGEGRGWRLAEVRPPLPTAPRSRPAGSAPRARPRRSATAAGSRPRRGGFSVLGTSDGRIPAQPQVVEARRATGEKHLVWTHRAARPSLATAGQKGG